MLNIEKKNSFDVQQELEKSNILLLTKVSFYQTRQWMYLLLRLVRGEKINVWEKLGKKLY